MKIVIELSDADLRQAVDEQVSKAIAALAEERIKAVVDEILRKKFERVDDKVIEAAVGLAAANLIRNPTSRGLSDYELRSRVDSALASAARTLLREHQSRV